MRRAWSSGYQAKTRGELADVAEAAFALVLHHQQLPFSVEKSGEGAPATAWGAHAGAPKGPALLPHLHSLRGATGTGSNASRPMRGQRVRAVRRTARYCRRRGHRRLERASPQRGGRRDPRWPQAAPTTRACWAEL